MELLQWHKVCELGGDKLYRPPVVALILFTVLEIFRDLRGLGVRCLAAQVLSIQCGMSGDQGMIMTGKCSLSVVERIYQFQSGIRYNYKVNHMCPHGIHLCEYFYSSMENYFPTMQLVSRKSFKIAFETAMRTIMGYH